MRMSAAPMMLTGCTLKAQVTIVMVTRGVPQDEVILEAMGAWLVEAETNSCVTIVTKLGIWTATVGTPLRHAGIAAQWIM